VVNTGHRENCLEIILLKQEGIKLDAVQRKRTGSSPYNTQRKPIRDTIRNVGYPYGRRCYTRVGGYHTAMESVLRGKMWVLRILRHNGHKKYDGHNFHVGVLFSVRTIKI
jgi:hypothetical protein